jgi:hypothetical protein
VLLFHDLTSPKDDDVIQVMYGILTSPRRSCETLMKNGARFLLISLFLFSFKNITAEVPSFMGASGITRYGNEFLIVGDKDGGAYYRYPLTEKHGPVIPIDLSRLQRVQMPGACLALDLESIDVLADGRIVVLSEGLSALASDNGLVAEYGGPFSELAGIGTEGVAVRPLENGSSRVAIVWEGGYPEFEKIPTQLRGKVARAALKPVVFIHDVPKGENCGRFKINESDTFELKVPLPQGKEPFAQRFRVPDVVWHKLKKNGKEEWGFIALLSSQNSIQDQLYLYDMLLRFDSNGEQFGKMLDLNKILPKSMRGLNWEGLGWFDQGKSLVLIFDNSINQSPAAFVVDLPEDWK